MIYYNQKSIGARIIQADEAIRNVQTNPDLSEALALQGYTEAELAAGRDLVDTVKAASTLRREQLGAQTMATSTADKAYRSLRQAFDADRRQFRQALFDEPGFGQELRLSESTSTRRGDFVMQARHFYGKVKDQTEKISLVQGYITPEYLDSRLQQIASLEEVFSIQRYLIGQTREVKKIRREAIDELDVWMKRFIAIAHVAFSDDRPKLSKLGIVVKSTRKPLEERDSSCGWRPKPGS